MSVILLLVALLDASQVREFRGQVVDPDGLAVGGATVVAVCGDDRSESVTDVHGEFALALNSADTTCSVTATRNGFAPSRIDVAPDHRGPFVLALRVAPVAERVEVAAPLPPLRQSIGSLQLDGGDLSNFFSSTEAMIRYAALAGGSRIGMAVYVDGLPANVLPPPELVGTLRVSPGPFSPEYGDGDVAAIQLVTTAAARRFRVRPGGSFLGFGGGDALRNGGLRSTSSSGSLAASGGVPGVPATVAGSFNTTRNERSVAIQAVVPSNQAFTIGVDQAGASALYGSSTNAGTISGVFAPSPALRVHGAYAVTTSEATNVGVGALVLPSSGLRSQMRTGSGQAGLTVIRSRYSFESGLTARASESSLRANTDARGLSVNGAFVAGGAELSLQRIRRLSWTSKQVARSSGFHPWLAGVVMTGTTQSHLRVPNPLGVYEFESSEAFADALDGASSALWSIVRGNGSMEYRGVTVAPFVSRTLVRKNRVQLDAGLRGDFQSGVGTVLSPRVWAAADWHGVEMQAGGGLFTQTVPDQVFVNATLGDGQHLQHWISTQVGLDATASDLRVARSVGTSLGPGLRAGRQAMYRLAASRPVGRLTPYLEYTYVRESSRLGADRFETIDGWTDVIDANRSARRHRIGSSLSYTWKRQTLTARHEWIHAFDDGDGPFSFAEVPGQLAGEWARSSRWAPQGIAATATLSLPWQIYGAITETWQNGAPFNITLGVDADRNGLFNERGGLGRNSGTLPSQQNLSVHASRRFTMPQATRWLHDRYRLNLGLHLENATNSRSYTTLGSVAGSSTFGTPLTASPSRSIRFTVTLE